MPSELSKYSLRIPQIYLDKMRYIAEENGRSTNKELEMMIKKRIKQYEEANGQIDLTSL